MASAANTKKPSFFCCCFGAPRVHEDTDMSTPKKQLSDALLAQETSVSSPRASRRSSSGMVIRKLAIASATGRKSDQGFHLASQHSLTQGDLPNLQPLMASNIDRQYTDADWFAAQSALDKAQKVQQQHALQLLRGLRSNYSSIQDDDVAWFSPRSRTISTASQAFISDAERDEVSCLAQELEPEAPAIDQEAPSPNCVPNPPLLAADPNWKYCPVDVKPFCFYWQKDTVRSTPAPLPIDEQMKLNALGHKIHQAIPGTWFREVGDQMLMHANPSITGIPNAIAKYTEYYNKDQTPSNWTMRRDIKVGKSVGQMFMTTDGMLILRTTAYGIFSKNVEWINEDYMRLEDNGETIVTRQVCKVMADNSVKSQFLIGRKAAVPPKH